MLLSYSTLQINFIFPHTMNCLVYIHTMYYSFTCSLFQMFYKYSLFYIFSPFQIVEVSSSCTMQPIHKEGNKNACFKKVAEIKYNTS